MPMNRNISKRLIAFVMVIATALSVLSFAPLTYASIPPVNIYSVVENNAHNWNGYYGNSTIYMTKYTNDTSFEGVNSTRAAQDFEEVNSWGYQSSKNNTNGTPNSLYLAAGNNSGGFGYSQDYAYLFVDLPIAFMGAFRNSSESTYVINNVEMSVRTSGPNVQPRTETCLNYLEGSGFNTTGPLDIDPSNYSETLVSLGLTGLGVLSIIADAPYVGYAIAATSSAYAVYGASTGHSPTMVSSATGNSTVYEYFAVKNGSTIGSGNTSFFNRVFGCVSNACIVISIGICIQCF